MESIESKPLNYEWFDDKWLRHFPTRSGKLGLIEEGRRFYPWVIKSRPRVSDLIITDC